MILKYFPLIIFICGFDLMLQAQDLVCYAGDATESGNDYGSIVIQVPEVSFPATIAVQGPVNHTMNIESAGEYSIENLSAGNYTLIFTDNEGYSSICNSSVLAITRNKSNISLCKCIEIGKETDDCVKWNPTAGLDEPMSGLTLACPQETTTYILFITDNDGNLLEIVEHEVVVEQSIQVVNGPPVLCGTDPVVLNAGSGYDSYVWNNGSTASQISVLQAGVYSVTVTLGNCSSEKEIEVVNENSGSCVDDYLASLGFYKFNCKVIDLPSFAPNESREKVNGEAIIELLGEQYNLQTEIDEITAKLNAENRTSSWIITYNQGMCNGDFSAGLQQYNSSTADVNIWFHICDDPSSDEDAWYVKTEDFDLVASVLYGYLTVPPGFQPLFKNDLKNYIMNFCNLTPTDNCIGSFYENAYIDWGLANYLPIIQFNRYIGPSFPGNRPTKPDATNRVQAVGLSGPPFWIDHGEWHEVKAKYNSIRLSTDSYQIRSHQDNLRFHLGPNYNLGFALGQLKIVSTHDSYVSFDVFSYDKNISVNHLWGYYKINTSGRMEIQFGLWDDWSPVSWLTGMRFIGTSVITSCLNLSGCNIP